MFGASSFWKPQTGTKPTRRRLKAARFDFSPRDLGVASPRQFDFGSGGMLDVNWRDTAPYTTEVYLPVSHYE